MAVHGPEPKSNTIRWLLSTTLLIAIVVAGAIWFTRQPVTLNENEYAITLALYRVCNQRSAQGLADVQELWSSSKPANQGTVSRRKINSIIADAKAQRWKAASRACRQVLEEQIKY